MNSKQQTALSKRIVALAVAYPKIIPAYALDAPLNYCAVMQKEVKAYAKEAVSTDARWNSVLSASKKELEDMLFSSACVVGAIRVARKHVLAQEVQEAVA